MKGFKDEYVKLRYIHRYKDEGSDVSHGLQRPYDKLNTKRLIKNFMIEKVGLLHCCPGPGQSLYCFCGQHRLEACKEVLGPDKEVLIRVYRGYSVTELADIAEGLDAQKNWAAIYNWARRRTGKDETVLKIDSILHRYSLVVDYRHRPDTKSMGLVKACGALETVYQKFGPDKLEQVISILKAAWGGHVAVEGAYEGTIISSLGWLMGGIDGINEKRMADQLRKWSNPFKLIGDGRSTAKSLERPLMIGVAVKLAHFYNKKLTSKSGTAIPITMLLDGKA